MVIIESQLTAEIYYLLSEDCDGGVVEAAEPRNLPPLVGNQPHLHNINLGINYE